MSGEILSSEHPQAETPIAGHPKSSPPSGEPGQESGGQIIPVEFLGDHRPANPPVAQVPLLSRSSSLRSQFSAALQSHFETSIGGQQGESRTEENQPYSAL